MSGMDKFIYGMKGLGLFVGACTTLGMLVSIVILMWQLILTVPGGC